MDRAGSRTAMALTRVSLLVVFALSATACTPLPRNPVPVEHVADARVPEMPDVRAWAARHHPATELDLKVSFSQERPGDFVVTPDGTVLYPCLLISGGGANGAFGAGFLKGWTETGTRPLFKLVTGVSTGALMAPFAFLGPAYDDALREIFTTTSTRDLLQLRSLLPQLVAGEALASTRPLADMIARYVDAPFMEEIAQAHQQGRRLYLGTVDLDAQQFVVWNMGLIALEGSTDALELFRKVMLASASIPAAFPPVLIEVEMDGRRYDEMHVDGAVAANVFLSGGVFRERIIAQRGGLGRGQKEIFIIHNGQLQPRPASTRRNLRAISVRALESALKASMVGNLFRIYAIALREQSGFRWTTMPAGVEVDSTEIFDPVAMQELFNMGHGLALEGPVWRTDPPGVRADQEG